jgi:uncharacterized Zn finger protein (UPF0148 family)
MPIVSKPANQAYRDNFDATFGKKEIAKIACKRCGALYFDDYYTWCPACDAANVAVLAAQNPERYDSNAVENIRVLREKSQREAAAAER